MNTIKSLWKLYSPIRRYLPVYMLALVVVGSRNFVINYLTAFLYSDIAFAARNMQTKDLWSSAAAFVLGVLLFVIVDTAGYFLWSVTIHRMVSSLKRQIHTSILRADLFYYDRNGGSRSDMLSRINHDMQIAEGIFSNSLLMPVMSLISGIGAVVTIFGRSRIMAVYLLSAGTVVMTVQFALGRKMHRLSGRRQTAFSRVNTVVNELNEANPAIRLADMTRAFAIRMEKALNRYKDTSRDYAKNQAGFGMVEGIAFLFQYVGVAFFGLSLLSASWLEVEDLLFILQMGTLIVTMFSTMGSTVASLQKALAGAERILELTDITEEKDCVIETGHGTELDSCGSRKENPLEIDGFAVHISADCTVGTSVRFVVKEGTATAICGKSGRGKSTFFRILLGLYPCHEGVIRFYGRPLSEVGKAVLRNQMTYVQQTAFAIPDTIRNNLLLGTKHVPDKEQLIKAISVTLCDEWLPGFPLGLETVLNENGEPLSGGQMQSLALARALLRQTPILLLDESFANIDLEHTKRILD